MGYYFSGFIKLAKAIQKQDIEHEKGFRSIESTVALGLEVSPGFGDLSSTSIAGMGTMKIVDCFTRSF